jgi:hypothetical protein
MDENDETWVHARMCVIGVVRMLYSSQRDRILCLLDCALSEAVSSLGRANALTFIETWLLDTASSKEILDAAIKAGRE